MKHILLMILICGIPFISLKSQSKKTEDIDKDATLKIIKNSIPKNWNFTRKIISLFWNEKTPPGYCSKTGQMELLPMRQNRKEILALRKMVLSGRVKLFFVTNPNGMPINY